MRGLALLRTGGFGGVITQKQGSWSATYTAKASNISGGSRYTARVKLPSTGRWRVRAVHAEDSLNAKTHSSYGYVTVK